jgi:endo-1,4-beta-D-glucanase Y
LEAGEQLPLRELLYGLLLNSGNDAGIAIAEHLGGSVPGFSSQMNARAGALGMTDTRFNNPHGLDHWIYASPDHFSSARDLALLGAAVFANPTLREIDATLERTVPNSLGGEAHRMRHSITALWWYPGAIGGKTGWTEKAGQVRVVGAERGGTRLVAVVMDSPDHVRETRDLFDYGFALKSPAGQPEPSSTVTGATSMAPTAIGGATVVSPVPVGAAAMPLPDQKLLQAWQAYKQVALTPEGRVRRGPTGNEGSADAQAAAMLEAVWLRDRAAFDALWGWTHLALSRRQPNSANPLRDDLFASRWSSGSVTDWNNSTAADQRIGAALLLASRLWNEPDYATGAQKTLDAVLDKAAISWGVSGVPAMGSSITSANTFLKDLEPVTTSGAALTPAFYRMFSEATRSGTWLWALDGTYTALSRAASPAGPLGGGAGLIPGWFSVSKRRGDVGLPIDPGWQSTGFSPEAASLVWQLGLDVRWNGEERARTLLDPTSRLVTNELQQRGRVAATYSRAGVPGSQETTQYGQLAGALYGAQVTPAAEGALRSKLETAVVSRDADRILDAMDGLWLLAGGPPNFWRVWNPPADLPTTRNDAVVPPVDGYPWRYYAETGHVVHGQALEFFNANGGVQTFGFPRTDEMVEDGKTVQYFQRGRVEFGPDRAWVALSPLGSAAAQRRGAIARPEARPVAPFESTEDRLFVPETSHSVVTGFKTYYEARGGAAVLGLPITEEMTEDGFTVQYFERAVLEYQPGKTVQASLLGDDSLREKGWLK